ncbi:MAG: hypothetical protein ACJAY8_000082 [Sphingobacteriales bacterium]|jgi:hypothetical protein
MRVILMSFFLSTSIIGWTQLEFKSFLLEDLKRNNSRSVNTNYLRVTTDFNNSDALNTFLLGVGGVSEFQFMLSEKKLAALLNSPLANYFSPFVPAAKILMKDMIWKIGVDGLTIPSETQGLIAKPLQLGYLNNARKTLFVMHQLPNAVDLIRVNDFFQVSGGGGREFTLGQDLTLTFNFGASMLVGGTNVNLATPKSQVNDLVSFANEKIDSIQGAIGLDGVVNINPENTEVRDYRKIIDQMGVFQNLAGNYINPVVENGTVKLIHSLWSYNFGFGLRGNKVSFKAHYYRYQALSQMDETNLVNPIQGSSLAGISDETLNEVNQLLSPLGSESVNANFNVGTGPLQRIQIQLITGMGAPGEEPIVQFFSTYDFSWTSATRVKISSSQNEQGLFEIEKATPVNVMNGKFTLGIFFNLNGSLKERLIK